MIPQKFTYTVKDLLKAICARDKMKMSQVKFLRIDSENNAIVRSHGRECIIHSATIGDLFGSDGGFYDSEGYHEPTVKWETEGKEPTLTVMKSILTENEFWEVMRRHNVGFADKGNPKVLKAVIVYNPSASNWHRYLWDCELKDRAYYCWSNAEVFLEDDPSAGMCRHAHCYLESLRGDRAHGGESLLRMDYSWKVDYCYIESEEQSEEK